MTDRALTAAEMEPDSTHGVDDAVRDDILFFRQNPHRKHRLRLANPAEQFEAAMAGMRTEEGERVFVVTRFHFDGGKPPIDAWISNRAFLRLPYGAEEDTSEARARALYADLLAKRPNLAKADSELSELAARAEEAVAIQQMAEEYQEEVSL